MCRADGDNAHHEESNGCAVGMAHQRMVLRMKREARLRWLLEQLQ